MKKTRKVSKHANNKTGQHFGIRDYTNVLAEGIHAFKSACRMLGQVNLMLVAVQQGLNASPEIFEEADLIDFKKITDEMIANVDQSSVELENIQYTYLTSKEAMDAGKDGDMIPKFTRDDSLGAHEWVNSLNQEIVTSLAWTQSSAEIMGIIATVAETLATTAIKKENAVTAQEEAGDVEATTEVKETTNA